MSKAKITKVENGEALREPMEGFCNLPPKEDERFEIINGEPLSDDEFTNARLVTTSPVQEVETVEEGVWRIHTLNSVYRIEIIS